LSVFDTATSPYRLTGPHNVRHARRRGTIRNLVARQQWLVQRFSTPTRSVRDSFTTRQLRLAPPADFAAEPEDADAMTFENYANYIGRLTASGFTVTDQRVNLHKKIAYPLVTLVMTVLGVPFAVTTGRRGALYGIGLAIAVAISYWLISAISLAMGAAGILRRHSRPGRPTSCSCRGDVSHADRAHLSAPHARVTACRSGIADAERDARNPNFARRPRRRVQSVDDEQHGAHARDNRPLRRRHADGVPKSCSGTITVSRVPSRYTDAATAVHHARRAGLTCTETRIGLSARAVNCTRSNPAVPSAADTSAE